MRNGTPVLILALLLPLAKVTPASVSPELVNHLEAAKQAASRARMSGKVLLIENTDPDGRPGRAEYHWAYAAGKEHETLLTGLNLYEAVWDGKQGTLRTRPDESAHWSVTGYKYNQSAVSPIRDGYFATLGGGSMRQAWVLDVIRTPGAVARAMPGGRFRIYTPSSDGALDQFVELRPDWGYMIDLSRDIVLAAPDPVTGKAQDVSERELKVTAARKLNGCWLPTSVEIRVVRHLASGATLRTLSKHLVTDCSAKVRDGEFRVIYQPGDLVRDAGATLRVVGNDGRLHPLPLPEKPTASLFPRFLVYAGLAGAALIAVQIVRGFRRVRGTPDGYWGPPG